MSILSYDSLRDMLPEIFPDRRQVSLNKETDLNPASIDIRVGHHIQIERQWRMPWYERLRYRPVEETVHDMVGLYIPEEGYLMHPHEFLLGETLEWIEVPDGFAIDLRLKSTYARHGYDHSLAFWVDPGWKGKLTTELFNNRKWAKLRLKSGQLLGQMIVHQLDKPAGAHAYQGHYQGAQGVESAKVGY